MNPKPCLTRAASRAARRSVSRLSCFSPGVLVAVLAAGAVLGATHFHGLESGLRVVLAVIIASGIAVPSGLAIVAIGDWAAGVHDRRVRQRAAGVPCDSKWNRPRALAPVSAPGRAEDDLSDAAPMSAPGREPSSPDPARSWHRQHATWAEMSAAMAPAPWPPPPGTELASVPRTGPVPAPYECGCGATHNSPQELVACRASHQERVAEAGAAWRTLASYARPGSGPADCLTDDIGADAAPVVLARARAAMAASEAELAAARRWPATDPITGSAVHYDDAGA